MTYPYRCTRRDCRKRVTLKKKKHEYIKKPVCKKCGGNITHDRSVRLRSSQEKCTCDGYTFPHRRKTEPWCIHAPVGPSEEDWHSRHFHLK